MHILPTRKLRFSRFENVNDPRESQDWALSFMRYSSLLDAHVAQISTDFNHHLKHDWRIGCFVADKPEAVVSRQREQQGHDLINAPYERGHSRPAMWWHYGARYRGACLVFDRARLDAAVRAASEAARPPLSGRVEYCNPSPLISFSNSGNALAVDCDSVRRWGVDEAARRHLQRHAKMLLFTKLLDWEPEREYRWAVPVESDDDFFLDIERCLVGIIVGDKFPQSLRSGIGEYARSNKVEVGYMTWQNGFPQPKRSRPDLIDKIEVR